MNNEKLAGMKIGEPVIGHVVDCSKLNVRKGVSWSFLALRTALNKLTSF